MVLQGVYTVLFRVHVLHGKWEGMTERAYPQIDKFSSQTATP